jgi:hypothetical protein
MLYESRYVPLGAKRPLLAPGDFAGATITSRPNHAAEMILHALGATPTAVNGADAIAGARDGSIQGTLEGIDQPSAPFSGTVTANAVLFLRTTVLVINAKVFNGLTDAQRDVITRAATATRDWWPSQRPDEVAAAGAACARGDDVAIASIEQIADLRRATNGVVDAMARDPFTRRAIDRIETLGAGVAEPKLAPCPGSTTAEPGLALPKPAGDQSVLDGEWRLEVAAATLQRAGITGPDVGNNSGTWTFDLKGGVLTGTEPHGVPCNARYTIAGHRLGWSSDPADACGGRLLLRFRRWGDRLRFVPLATDDVFGSPAFVRAFFDQPLRRIGDAP